MPDTVLSAATPSTPGIPDVSEPFGLFETWLEEAKASEPNDPNALALATATPDGRPSVRMVLLKGFDAAGFVFYTNYQSRKGGELQGNPHAALLFHWKSLRRQVRVEGAVSAVTDAEADAYFASRARVSRLGAIASEQSRPLPSRDAFERRVETLDAQFPGDTIPRPPHWSGFRVAPHSIEFWQDMPFRLHDRRVFTRDGDGWRKTTLYP
ncbi:MAG: pyridoxamine 5'-phosphate oxidase [Pseudomonadota bacterium]|nr:pyridoxamine 5'-phosphate oxidase [Pseudomonadota bacterium]